MRNRWLAALVLLAFAFGITQITAAPPRETLHRAEPVTVESGLDINVDYSLGRFILKPGSPDTAFVVDLRYEETLFDPSVEYDIRGDIGYLSVNSSNEKQERNFDWDIDTKSSWDVQFNPELPAQMEIDIGLGKGLLDLGGATISRLEVSNGLAESELDFSEPNKTAAQYMSFETGMGKFRAKNLSNARFQEMSFECGLGSATLDFHGNGLNRSEVSVSVGLGSVTIIVPEGLGVRVDTDRSFMSGVSFDSDFVQRDDVYYTSNWNEADKKMRINLEVGLGSANVEILP